MTLCDVMVNNELHLVDLDVQSGRAVDIHTGEEYDDYKLFMSYGTNDYYKLFSVQEHLLTTYERHIANVRQEYLVRRQTEIIKNVKSCELKQTDYYRDVVRINRIISKKMCHTLNYYINNEFDNNRLNSSGELTYGKKRYDMIVPNEGLVSEILKECCLKLNVEVNKVIETAVMISEPGSQSQAFHPDYSDKELQTCFIALQDVTEDMGPTQLIPNTNDMDTLERFEREDRMGFPLDQPNVLGILNCGDALIYHVRTIHRGTANESTKRRNLFYFTYSF